MKLKKMLPLFLAAVMLTCAAAAEKVYPTITLNSEDYQIGTVYMAESMISTEAINPMTVAPYTEEEIAALKAGDAVDLEEGCVLGLSVNGSDTVYSYDAEDAAAILSHADPLVLNTENGEVLTMDGDYVVMKGIGYAAITLDNADYGIGTVYFNASRFTVEAINPLTVIPYTTEEIEGIFAGEGIVIPADAVIALSVYGTDMVFFYNAEEAASILRHADPLVLNAETGAVTTTVGEIVVAAE